MVSAEYGRPTPSRVAQRNGCRHHDLDTHVGTIDVAIPKLRKGSYFLELLERHKRAESALTTTAASPGSLRGRMDKLVEQLGIDGARGWPLTWTRSLRSSATGPWAMGAVHFFGRRCADDERFTKVGA